jgi:hypothetical protein
LKKHAFIENIDSPHAQELCSSFSEWQRVHQEIIKFGCIKSLTTKAFKETDHFCQLLNSPTIGQFSHSLFEKLIFQFSDELRQLQFEIFLLEVESLHLGDLFQMKLIGELEPGDAVVNLDLSGLGKDFFESLHSTMHELLWYVYSIGVSGSLDKNVVVFPQLVTSLFYSDAQVRELKGILRKTSEFLQRYDPGSRSKFNLNLRLSSTLCTGVSGFGTSWGREISFLHGENIQLMSSSGILVMKTSASDS